MYWKNIYKKTKQIKHIVNKFQLKQNHPISLQSVPAEQEYKVLTFISIPFLFTIWQLVFSWHEIQQSYI